LQIGGQGETRRSVGAVRFWRRADKIPDSAQ
jgi:hypothetical protein